MRIAFETELLREICLNAEVAEGHLGVSAAAELFAVLADINAADSAVDLFMAEFEEDNETHGQCIQLHFGEFGALVLVSNHARHNRPSADRVNWSQVKRIRIVEFKDNAD